MVSNQDAVVADLSTMMDQHVPHGVFYDIYNVSQFPWWCLNLFMTFWLLSNVIEQYFLRFAGNNIRDTFKSLDANKQNNVIIYVVQIIGTLVALILQVWGGADVVFQWEDATTNARMEALQVSIQLINVLYIWELIYRKEIGVPLLIHHLVTIVNIQLATASFFDTHDVLYVRFGVLIGFHATTEQLSFVALLLYRLNLYPKWQSILFYVSAAQAFAVKTMVTTITSIYFIVLLHNGRMSFDTNWGAFWTVFFFIMTVCLYGAQVYACRVLYIIGKKSDRKDTKDTEARTGAIQLARQSTFMTDDLDLTGEIRLSENLQIEKNKEQRKVT